jgi:glucokinase-like ROK family protein
MNLSLILNALRVQAPLSRTELALATGLNKATVSSMVRELLLNGFVQELGVASSLGDVGRPAIKLGPDPDAGYVVGVEIGVDFISVVTANFAAEVVARRYESTLRHRSQQAILDRLLFLLRESVGQVARRAKPLFGVGVGVPGLVDVSTGTLLFAPNLGWRDVPLGQMLEDELEVPVYVANEANLAALGESFFGAGEDGGFMLYVSSGIGIGGGIVLNGRLVEGATGFAGEVGHMMVEQAGRPCNCGSRGCWETVASQRALFERIEDAVAGGASSLLEKTTNGDLGLLTVPLIVEAADKNDEVALQALEETGRWLGIGFASLMNVINPRRVVFGGPLSRAHEYLLPRIRQTVSERAWDWVHERAEIVLAAHGEDAAALGGVAIIYRDVVNEPRRWLR